MINDILLIQKIKEQNDNGSFIELVNRHTGIYNTMVYKYLHTGNNNDYHDLIAERDYNFYSFIKSFDESKNMKFSTYVGDRTKYICLNKNFDNNKVIKVELNDEISIKSQPDIDLIDKDTMQKLKEAIENIQNLKFKKIMELRFLSSTRTLTYKEIAKQMNVTTQYVNNIYQDNINNFIKTFKNSLN